MIKSRMTRWDEHVKRREENLTGKDLLVDLGVDVKIILK
jgi:hypothetical protein